VTPAPKTAPGPAATPPVTTSPPAAAPAASLSLTDAVERALGANPTIAAARLRGAIDAASLAVAREVPNPEVDFEAEKETPHHALGVALPLELGGKRARRIDVGRAAMSTGEAELALVISQIRNDVRRAYDQVLLADARLAVLREASDLTKRARDAAQTRFDAGDAPRLEVLQAELGLGAAENEAMAAEGVLLAARTRLNVLLAQPLDTLETLTTSIESGGPVAVNQALELTRQSSAELALLDRQIEEQRAKVALARALRTPDVTPSAAVTHDSEPEFTWGWRAGLA
jgi:cobalt-zinc-cadmium efflux system outer membrane protein